MLCKNMYVRCPLIQSGSKLSNLVNVAKSSDEDLSVNDLTLRADMDEMINARHFIMGRVKNVDKFRGEVTVEFLDPFKHREYYDEVPKEYPYPVDIVKHCMIFTGSTVIFNKKLAHVLKCMKDKDGLYSYYIQIMSSKDIFLVKEYEIEASFLNGLISPKEQLKNYEFQNPKWYLARSIVNKIVKTIDNSIVGFKELAGCKIFLMPHQLNTIVRCLQNENIRVMLADEVGMGKTIESASVLKIYLTNNCNKRILILVPETIKEQWRIELFLKFNIDEGNDYNKNDINICSYNEIEQNQQQYDFVIIDEVHRCLNNIELYQQLYNISKNSKNILLLSATPLQKQTQDYLKLLRILDPQKYDKIQTNEFEKLLGSQNKITQSLYGIMNDICTFNEEIQNKEAQNNDLLNDKVIKNLFGEIKTNLNEMCSIINDSTYEDIVSQIDIHNKDYGIQNMKIAVSYICDNFQLERNIIRNRRKILQKQYDNKINSIRHLYKEIKYEWIGTKI